MDMSEKKNLLDSVDARTRLAGSNKMEILLFSLGTKETFGINVFKVREVGRTPHITKTPNMDVVKTNIQKLNGAVEIRSEPGKGSVFLISLPLTLAILPVLLVLLEDQPFALPLSMVDKSQDGELLRRIRGIRKKFAQEVGFLVPPVHIRDNLELRPNAYRILLKGVEIGQGEAYPGQFLAINPGRVAGTVPGNATKDPAFGLPAIWIEMGFREQAQSFGYTVVDTSTVVATHLNHLIQSHAPGRAGHQPAGAG